MLNLEAPTGQSGGLAGLISGQSGMKDRFQMRTDALEHGPGIGRRYRLLKEVDDAVDR